MEIVVMPVGYVHNQRTDLSDDYWGSVVSEIELVSEIPPSAFDGIDSFTHLEIVFHFNQADPEKLVFDAHPRGNKEWPRVGIFAQRKKDRPNRIGITIVELVKREANKIWVRYLDAIEGTPVIDIKPVMKEFLPLSPVMQPAWSSELMKVYWG